VDSQVEPSLRDLVVKIVLGAIDYAIDNLKSLVIHRPPLLAVVTIKVL
jgi:hypothetical protein